MFLQFAENEVPLHMVTKPYFDSIIKILFYQYKNEKKEQQILRFSESSYKQASRGKKKHHH
jgi:hypothetical protein